MARTGFYDKSQDLYLPKDSTTWADLTSGWDTYTGWYQTLSVSTELEFTTNIIDFGYAHTVFPLIIITAFRDGATSTAASYGDDYPEILIEAGNQSDLSDAVSVTMTRTASPAFTSLGSKRYYRVTVTINSGINSAPNGMRGINISLLTDAIDETVEQFNTATYDDGSTATRTIPLQKEYSSISFVGITPRSTITDTVVTGVSSDGSSVIYYVTNGYVNTGYFVGDTGSTSVTTSTITTVPLVRLVSTAASSFTVQVYKPNTAAECDVIADAYIRGLPPVAMDENGNVIRLA
jgi:hypothetical protein